MLGLRTLPDGGARIRESFHRTDMKGDRMEPTDMNPETGIPGATRKPSRIKAAVVATLIAGALSTWAVASVFAADPSASPGASAPANGSGSSSGSSTDNCPAHASASPSTTSSSSSS